MCQHQSSLWKHKPNSVPFDLMVINSRMTQDTTFFRYSFKKNEAENSYNLHEYQHLSRHKPLLNVTLVFLSCFCSCIWAYVHTNTFLLYRSDSSHRSHPGENKLQIESLAWFWSYKCWYNVREWSNVSKLLQCKTRVWLDIISINSYVFWLMPLIWQTGCWPGTQNNAWSYK